MPVPHIITAEQDSHDDVRQDAPSTADTASGYLRREFVTRRIATTDDPSENLRSRFARLEISERQWRRAAKRHLREIAGDLPLFDSAWIDACVCDRLLTSWQADVLNSATPDQFAIGPTIIERITAFAPEGTLYEGRHQDASRPIEVFFLEESVYRDQESIKGLRNLVEQGRTHELALVQWPIAFVDDQMLGDVSGGGVVFSRTPGVTLRELIVRRGRLDETIVRSIALQIFSAIEQLESIDCVHGDIRTETVRIAENGTISLLRCGLRPAFQPAIVYSESLSPRSCVAIAPERIGNNAPASSASDRYALGCLLWELLAGRPVTPHGSALGCLRAHHLGDLPELGDFAPDTSNEFLDVIRRLLSADPDERPRSMTQTSTVARRQKQVAPVKAVRLVRTSQPTGQRSAAGRVMTIAATMLLTAGAWFTWPTIQSSLAENEINVSPGQVHASIETVPERRLMSVTPDASGFLQLPSGTLEASQIVWSGALTISGATDGSTIISANAIWELFADTVTLEHVTIVGNASPNPLADIHAQNVIIRDSRFLSTGRSSAIRWTALNISDQSGRNLRVEQSRFDGDNVAIELTTDPRTVAFQDTVVTGFNAVTQLARWTRSPARMVLDHCTARDVGTLVNCEDPNIGAGQRFAISLRSSLFEPAGPTLVQTGDVAPNEVLARFPLDATTSLSTRTWPVVAIGPRDNLQIGQLTFEGPSGGADRNSILQSANVPLPVDAWPGARKFATVRSLTRSTDSNISTAESAAAIETMER